MINLQNPEHSYFFGFVQADGHLYESTRNRGKLTIELNGADKFILEQFKKIVPVYSSIRDRERDTNFKEDYNSSVLTVCNLEFRQALLNLGLQPGKKCSVIEPPSVNFSTPDYYRGLVDGDGSLGLTSNGFPFLSLTTSSDAIKDSFVELIKRLTGKAAKEPSRNKRDGVYNITVYKEDAQTLVDFMYYEGCLALERKKQKAQEVMQWNRPDDMKKVDFERKNWEEWEDLYISEHSVEDSVDRLGRTSKSIKIRLWRLKQLRNQ